MFAGQEQTCVPGTTYGIIDVRLIPGSSNGRTADFESVSWGSNPCPGTDSLTKANPPGARQYATNGLGKVWRRGMAAVREGRGKSGLHRAGCLAKAGAGPVAGPDSPYRRPRERARATVTNATCAQA